MKKIIKINRESQLAYFSDDFIREGYVDDVEILLNYNTGIMLKPGSTTKEQIRSVKRLLEDLEDRVKSERRHKNG